jgi:multimeric flavodoxin WrbA
MLAKTLREKLKCDILKVEEVKQRNGFTIALDLLFNRTPRIKPYLYDIASYDQFVFVAPVWAGKIASPLKSFLIQERFYISNYSFITICGGQPGQKEKLTTNLINIMQHEPGAVQELWINNLLPESKRNTVKYTSGYRIRPDDLEKFSVEIDEFLTDIRASYKRRQMVG